jgi:hypothetical protein
MFRVGMDSSRHRLGVRVVDEGGVTVAELAVAPPGRSCARWRPETGRRGRCGVIESMNGR